MAGKKTNQYDVDFGDGSAPDNANPPDEHLRAAAKQKVAQTRTDERKAMIPSRGDNPALADLKARRAAGRKAKPSDGEG